MPDVSKRPLARHGKRAAVATTCLSVTAALTIGAAPPADAGVLSGVFGLLNGVVSTVTHILSPDGIWGYPAADKAATTSNGAYSAGADPGSLYTIDRAIGSRSVWMQQDASRRQLTGQGVGVALLDSGVSLVPGLDGPGKVVYGPDLSIEANGPLTDEDTFGHGTHLGGIIAAHDPVALTRTTIPALDPATQLGVAPEATLEALKLATTDGSTDVSQVIAALDWIAQHPTMPDGTRVRVVNLAFGTDSLQAYQSDPLAAAAENAWRHGLVVVVSGGNEGPSAGRLTDPAMDPYVLSVGASDSNNTVAGWANPGVASFSSSGTWQRHVDLLAPGRSVASLRDPNSFVDTNHPEGRVASDTTGRLFRGSGTSQAAAVVSGAVALLLQAYPNLTPDQVKYLLTHSATPVAASPVTAGAGQIDVAAALSDARNMTGTLSLLTSGLTNATQRWTRSTGQGSLEAARGGSHLVDANGVALSGEIDVQGLPWTPATWWPAAASLTAWQDGSWNGALWTGAGWASVGGWSSARWSSARWSSARWSSARWSDAAWDSARWSSARWSSARWSDAQWSSARWSGDRWN
ncbi:MAG: S8 family serine peptidase [Jatrophihabitantaceae bacterium]